MTKEEILRLALDALEGFIPYLPLKDEAQCNRYDKAITALRLFIDAQKMASKSTYEEQLETKELAIEKTVEEANYIIFKSCINQSHWKRSAMHYLKRNAPMLHHQAAHDFNEHPDGRGQE
jgi:hypothetical protein